VTISIVGTTDLHGYVFPSDDRGGLALFGGYMKALRSARAADGGAVILVDAGDALQGGVESGLSEGALVIDAYNALGYTAAAIGNHEFDFGAVDLEGAREGPSDRRGAIKARARQARFPFLAANLIEEATGRVVDWPNVRPSVLIDAAGIKVGIVGVMTFGALRATLPANVRGLGILPLAGTIAAEASKLREGGAEAVIVVAHAGGRCTSFDDPFDLSSCDPDSEIFQVARALPRGLVNVIAAGHSHEALAHYVEGIAIVQAYPRGQAFARADLLLSRVTRQVTGSRVFPPRPICAEDSGTNSGCLRRDRALPPPAPARYEGSPVVPDPAVVAAMVPALERVRQIQAMPLGVVLGGTILRGNGIESPLGNMFADAVRDSSPGTDAAITNNRIGGLRADLPAGPLTIGQLYDVFPFDNRIVRLRLTGADLTRVLVEEINRRRPGTWAISGLRVRASCEGGSTAVQLYRPSGRPVDGTEQLVIATVDSLAAGAVFSSMRPPGGVPVTEDAPLLREAVERWLRGQGERVIPERFVNPHHPRWTYPDGPPTGCGGA
jgi:5'-nucleotidase